MAMTGVQNRGTVVPMGYVAAHRNLSTARDCVACETPLMVAVNDQGYIVCPACGHAHPATALAHLREARKAVDAAREPFPQALR